MEMKERFCIVFKADDLDIDGVRAELNGFTNCHVAEEEDTTMEYTDDSGKEITEAVHIFYMEGSVFSHIAVRFRFNCFDLKGHPAYGDNGRYVLFPR